MSEQQNSPRGVAQLEANLDACQSEVQRALARVQDIDSTTQEGGMAAAQAYGRAVQFMKLSAKVGMALAKLNGAHTSNIRIVRREEAPARTPDPEPEPTPPPRSRPRHGKINRKPLTPEEAARVDKIYYDWLAAREAKEAAEAARIAAGGAPDPDPDPENEDEDDWGEGVPPSNFGGSNAADG